MRDWLCSSLALRPVPSRMGLDARDVPSGMQGKAGAVPGAGLEQREPKGGEGRGQRCRKSCFGSNEGFGLRSLENKQLDPVNRHSFTRRERVRSTLDTREGRWVSALHGAGARGADPGATRCHGAGGERSWSVFGKPGAGNRRAVPCHAVCRARGGCGQPERQLCRRGCAAVSAPGCDSAVTQAGDACGVALGSILLFALVPRLCDSGPGAAGAESAGQRWRRGRG